jgi:hypothetical protein
MLKIRAEISKMKARKTIAKIHFKNQQNYWHKHRQVHQWNRIEDPGRNPCLLFYTNINSK